MKSHSAHAESQQLNTVCTWHFWKSNLQIHTVIIYLVMHIVIWCQLTAAKFDLAMFRQLTSSELKSHMLLSCVVWAHLDQVFSQWTCNNKVFWPLFTKRREARVMNDSSHICVLSAADWTIQLQWAESLKRHSKVWIGSRELLYEVH